jgi:hypothetical protein
MHIKIAIAMLMSFLAGGLAQADSGKNGGASDKA